MIYALHYERLARPGETDEHGTPAVAAGFITAPYTYDDLVRSLLVWAAAGPIQLGCDTHEITWWVTSWTDEEFTEFYGAEATAAVHGGNA